MLFLISRTSGLGIIGLVYLLYSNAANPGYPINFKKLFKKIGKVVCYSYITIGQRLGVQIRKLAIEGNLPKKINGRYQNFQIIQVIWSSPT